MKAKSGVKKRAKPVSKERGREKERETHQLNGNENAHTTVSPQQNFRESVGKSVPIWHSSLNQP
jgi:hypothetical protein